MTTLSADPLFDADTSRPEVIVSAALYLMSTYGCKGGCPRLAHVIVQHLRVLAERADLPPVLRSTCQSLAEQWRGKLNETIAPAEPKRPTLAAVLGLRRGLH
jgi:hypothetical protein